MEHAVHIVRFFLSVEENFLFALFLEIIACGNKKSRRTARRVADDLISLGIHQLYHHTNDVARGAELTVKS